jgi:hypothetical protein
MKATVAMLSIALFCVRDSTAQLLYDDFNDGVVNTSIWSTSSPFGHSQIYESDGRAVMIGRGGLDTLQAFPTEIEISGRFRFTGQEDHFGVTIRSDLALTPTFAEKYGLRISFQDNSQSLRITEYDTDSSITELAFLSYALAVNTDYDFRITDDGSTIRLFMNGSGTPAIEGISTFRAGDRISVYNREFSISRSELDYISIVPEPSSSMLFGLGALAFWCRKHVVGSQ